MNTKSRTDSRLDRYEQLVRILEQRFTEKLRAEDVEKLACYSYRNINRIFHALHHESIGAYIKRMRLEKAAEYLSYSVAPISDIALELGFESLASFSKAFNSRFQCSPTAFRRSRALQREITRSVIDRKDYVSSSGEPPEFEVVNLPEMKVLSRRYQGSYENLDAIRQVWNDLLKQAHASRLLLPETLYIGEIIDDDEITDSIHCRYNACISLPDSQLFEASRGFEIRTIEIGCYARFVHRGSYESNEETYQSIYAHWLTSTEHELADRSTLEFYINDESTTAVEDLLTEIHIPILLQSR